MEEVCLGNIQKQEFARGNTKTNQNSSARAWCLTINNYSVEEEEEVKKQEKYIYQIETGETGTVHIQALVKYKNARRFETMKKKFPRANITTCISIKGSEQYCQKEDTRTRGPYSNYIDIVKRRFDKTKAKRWQSEILEMITEEADPRKIYWYWERKGNVGKTTLCKEICLRHKNKAIYVSGKGNDIKCAIASMEKKPEIVLWDIPRSSEDYVSYAAIEAVKNGIFFNGKYESGMCIFTEPHVVIFANFEPERHKLSIDRWVVKEIK